MLMGVKQSSGEEVDDSEEEQKQMPHIDFNAWQENFMRANKTHRNRRSEKFKQMHRDTEQFEDD